MRSVSQRQSTLKQFLPALVVLASLTGGSLPVCAQQSEWKPSEALPSGASHAAPGVQRSPEEIGDAMLARRRYREAIEVYSKIPNPSPDVWNKMGVSYQVMSDSKDALRCYKKSLRLRPTSARVLNNLGSVYDSLGDHSRAGRLYLQALKIDPNFPQAAMNLGTNLMIQNRYREGLEMYRRAAALAPDILDGVDATLTPAYVHPGQNGAINYYKARSFAQAGKTSRAIKYLRRAIDEGFTNPRMIAQDSIFAKLHGSPQFQRLLAEEREQ